MAEIDCQVKTLKSIYLVRTVFFLHPLEHKRQIQALQAKLTETTTT